MSAKISNTLSLLRETSSRTLKESILKNHDSPLLREVCKLACDPFITFGIRSIPEYTSSETTTSLSKSCSNLEPLIKRDLTGNTAIRFLRGVLSHSEEPEVIECIIEKDLKCGVSAKTLNKVFGNNFIPEMGAMLASKCDEKTIKRINFPAIAQLKYDGARCIIVIDSGKVQYFSRNGKPFHINTVERDSQLKELESAYYGFPVVLDGELLLTGESRRTSNGIANKAVHGTISEDEINRLEIHVWDMVPLKDYKNGLYTFPYESRFTILRECISELALSFLKPASSVTVQTYEDALGLNSKYIEDGEEGIILKDRFAPWENKRSPYMIKLKDVQTADLRVVDLVEGTGKHQGKLGAIVCRTLCDHLHVNVGTGFSDEQREYYWNNPAVICNQIVEVKYNAVIESKENDKKSLFLPVFSHVRVDKDTPNSLGDLK